MCCMYAEIKVLGYKFWRFLYNSRVLWTTTIYPTDSNYFFLFNTNLTSTFSFVFSDFLLKTNPPSTQLWFRIIYFFHPNELQFNIMVTLFLTCCTLFLFDFHTLLFPLPNDQKSTRNVTSFILWKALENCLCACTVLLHNVWFQKSVLGEKNSASFVFKFYFKSYSLLPIILLIVGTATRFKNVKTSMRVTLFKGSQELLVEMFIYSELKKKINAFWEAVEKIEEENGLCENVPIL